MNRFADFVAVLIAITFIGIVVLLVMGAGFHIGIDYARINPAICQQVPK